MTVERLWGELSIEGGDDAYVLAMRKNLNQINYWPLGRYMLTMLMKFGKTIRIVYHPRAFNSDKDLYSRPRFYCDPTYLYVTDIDPTTVIVRSYNKIYVYYFHELLHCYYMISGQGGKFGSPENEFRVTGLFEYEQDLLFTENAFRYEIDLPRRPVYSWVQVGGANYQAETVRRAAFGIDAAHAAPRNYMKGIEDQFPAWEKWCAEHRRP